MLADPLDDLPPDQRQAFLEKLALTLERDARWADDEGDPQLGVLMHSVGVAILSSAEDLSNTEIGLAEDVAGRAIALITAFHSRYPDYPVGPSLH